MDVNSSSRRKAELTYTPDIPIINANTLISFLKIILLWNTFLVKIIQTPSAANIIKIELKIKDSEVEVV